MSYEKCKGHFGGSECVKEECDGQYKKESEKVNSPEDGTLAPPEYGTWDRKQEPESLLKQIRSLANVETNRLCKGHFGGLGWHTGECEGSFLKHYTGKYTPLTLLEDGTLHPKYLKSDRKQEVDSSSKLCKGHFGTMLRHTGECDGRLLHLFNRRSITHPQDETLAPPEYETLDNKQEQASINQDEDSIKSEKV